MDALWFGIVTVIVFSVGAITGWKLHARTSVTGEQAETIAEQRQRAADSEARAREAETQVASLAATNIAQEKRIAELLEEREALTHDLANTNRGLSDLRAIHEADKARFQAEKDSLNEQMTALTEAEKRLTTVFEGLAGKVLDAKTETLTKQSTAQITLALDPLQKSLVELRTNLTTSSTTQDHLRQQLERLTLSTAGLTKSLIGDSKAQGDWGEQTLTRVLEASGLVRGKTYEMQGRFKDDEGSTKIPDIVVHMPEKRDIIIDSKVSLTAYHSYLNTDNPADKKQYLTAHVASVRSHIKSLAGQKYDHIPNLNPLHGTFMWMYSEGAVHEAMSADQSLIDDCLKLRIYPVGPTNLMTALTMVEQLWRMEQQNTSVQKIYRRAQAFYDKLRLFTESLDAIQKGLDTAQEAYRSARIQFHDGKGNVKFQLTELLRLGVKPKALASGDWAADDEEGSDTPPALPTAVEVGTERDSESNDPFDTLVKS